MKKAFLSLVCLSFLSFSGCSLITLLDPVFNYFLFRGDDELPEDDLLSEKTVTVDGFKIRVPEGWSILQNDEEITYLSVPDDENEVTLRVSIDPLVDALEETLPSTYFTNSSGMEFQMELILGPLNVVTFKYEENYYSLGFTIVSDEPIPELKQGEVWNPSVTMGYDQLKLTVEQMYKYMEPAN